MTVFYAYLGHTSHPHVYRYLITFANQGTANEWYRAIEDVGKTGKNGFKDVRRVSAQLYTFDFNTFGEEIYYSLLPDHPMHKFAGKVIFTYLPDFGSGDRNRLWPLPPPEERDPISGQRYFIRSKAAPHLYWVYSADKNQILASEHSRTAFRVERARRNPDTESNNLASNVMINDDDIYISLAFKQGSYVSNGSDNFLQTSGQGYTYKFKDLKYGFTTWDTTTAGATNYSQAADGPDPKTVKINVLASQFAGVGWELI